MKKLFLSVAAAILAFPVLADEGMWLLPLLKVCRPLVCD